MFNYDMLSTFMLMVISALSMGLKSCGSLYTTGLWLCQICEQDRKHAMGKYDRHLFYTALNFDFPVAFIILSLVNVY